MDHTGRLDKPDPPTCNGDCENCLDKLLNPCYPCFELMRRDDTPYDDLLCNHIYTGHQHDEPMTQTQDSRDSAGFPRP